jgi:tungstate transport system substrate-binding protein
MPEQTPRALREVAEMLSHSDKPKRFQTFTGLSSLLALAFCFFPILTANGQGTKTENAKNRVLILATTTSLQDSGLLDELVPLFQSKTAYVVKTIAVGTGQALAMGRRGDADLLLVHAPPQEKKFVDDGHGIVRRPFMYNDFVLVGPASDPAKVSKATSASEALRDIAASGALFLSRGDNSGTHILEQQLWMEAGRQPGGAWYQESGQGMGQTLTIASQKNAYTLTDRGTYLALKRRLELRILFARDPKLLNIYSLVLVNPRKSSNINVSGARAFLDFISSPETLNAIRTFGLDKYGIPLFELIKK